MIPFNYIIVDVMNTAYKVLEDRYKKTRFQNKSVYTKLFNNFVETLREIESKYLSPSGNVVLLFDNADSRQDLQDTFYNVKRKNLYPEYKVHRKKDNLDFYQTLDLIKYYYLVNSERYMCIQIPNLEADDLLKPVLDYYVKPKQRSLFVTNDSDWARYLSEDNFMLSNLGEGVVSIEDYERKAGYEISEQNVILYKSLFGDTSDNIPQIIPRTENNLKLFENI
jgi:5'-3' exonuclease